MVRHSHHHQSGEYFSEFQRRRRQVLTGGDCQHSCHYYSSSLAVLATASYPYHTTLFQSTLESLICRLFVAFFVAYFSHQLAIRTTPACCLLPAVLCLVPHQPAMVDLHRQSVLLQLYVRQACCVVLFSPKAVEQ